MGPLFRSINQRIAPLVHKHFRWNSHYRPESVIDNSEEYAAEQKGPSLACRVVYPNLVTNLKIPYLLYNALPGCTKYNETVYLESEPALSVRTSYKLAQIPNGRLYANHGSVAVITAENQLLEDVSYRQPTRQDAYAENPIFRQQYFIKPQHYSGTVCNLLSGGGAADNYLSWLMDVLPRLHLLQKAGLLAKVDWFVVPDCRHGFQKESLRLLGIDERKVIVASGHFHAQADLLLSTTAPRGQRSKVVPHWVVDFLRESFLPGPAGHDHPPFVYLESEPAALRVQNEPELKALLDKYGFRSYRASELSFAEKVQIFSSARMLLSATQVDLANLVFCREGAKVVEIMDSGKADTFHYNLACFAGLDYHFVPSKSHRYVLNPNPPADGGVVVEIHRLRLLLDKFTGRQVRMAEPEIAAEAVMAEAS